MKIKLSSVFIDNQDKALHFYTKVLSLIKKADFPVRKAKWLTVVSPDDLDGTELLLEPNGNPAAKTCQKAIFEQGIAATAFAVEDIQTELRTKEFGCIVPYRASQSGRGYHCCIG